VEDAPDKFILRQSFDTTALVDETYCADKFEFFDLMSGSAYTPGTYFTSLNLSLDTFTNLDTTLVLYTAIAAGEAKMPDEAAVFYTKLIDAIGFGLMTTFFIIVS
jgi:hypothetical protein